jgi:photosystem II stability/assembly factor-like uncharacterized protein
MNFYLTNILLVFGTVLLILTGCSGTGTDPNHPLSGEWNSSELSNRVNIVYPADDILLIGSSSGIYEKELTSTNKQWMNLGLATDSSEVVDIISWNKEEIMVAISYREYHTDNEVIFKTEDGGENWISYNDQFIGEHINNYLRRLTYFKDSPDKILALGGLPIAISIDRGLSWEPIYKTWKLTAFGEVIKIDPHNSDILWAGGETNIFTPHLVKSTDGGNSWERIDVIQNVETRVYDLIINANISDHILVGLGGSITTANVIRKSTDGGETWETVLEGINTRTFAHSAGNPGWVYASGRNATGNLFFVASGDFGESWETVEWEDSPAGVQINDMVSVIEGGREVLYFGTNKGVFSYSFEE